MVHNAPVSVIGLVCFGSAVAAPTAPAEDREVPAVKDLAGAEVVQRADA